MKHQATRLEELAKKELKEIKLNSKIKLICISSGKGGVGKSTIAANLAYFLAKNNYKTIIFDANIGLANLDIIFNQSMSKTMLNFLKGECPIRDIITSVDKNLDLIAGDSGEEVLKYSHDLIMQRFVQEVSILGKYDFMIIDTGVGMGDVKSYLLSSDFIILALTPEYISVTNTYATIESIESNENQKIFILANKVSNQEEGRDIFKNILSMIKEKLKKNIDIKHLGSILMDENIYSSIKRKVLFLKDMPNSKCATDMNNIGKELIKFISKS